MAVISGTVKDVNGDFARRVVRAYRRSDGAFASQVVSDAVTGAFSCAALDTSAHYALTLDGEVAEYDPYWSNVVLAMHMDDVGLADEKRHAVTLTGNVARSSTQSAFAGGYSAYFDGAGDYITTPYVAVDYDWWTQDFTVEMWVYAASWSDWSVFDSGNNHAKAINNGRIDTTMGSYWSFGPKPNGTLEFRYWTGVSNAVTSAATLSTSIWHHIAMCKTSGGIRLFIDGSAVTPLTAISGTPLSSSTAPYQMIIGGIKNSFLTGYIDDLRITKGVARYTANFTPPAAAFLHGLSIGAPSTNALIFDNITPV